MKKQSINNKWSKNSTAPTGEPAGNLVTEEQREIDEADKTTEKAEADETEEDCLCPECPECRGRREFAMRLVERCSEKDENRVLVFNAETFSILEPANNIEFYLPRLYEEYQDNGEESSDVINYFADVVFHSPIALPIPCAGDSDKVKVFVWFEDAPCVNPANDCPNLSVHRLVTTENASPILESEDDLDF